MHRAVLHVLNIRIGLGASMHSTVLHVLNTHIGLGFSRKMLHSGPQKLTLL